MKQRYGKYTCTKCGETTALLADDDDSRFICQACGNEECEFDGEFFWADDGRPAPPKERKPYVRPVVKVPADAKPVAEADRVYIRRQWNHWETAYASFDDLDGFRWDTFSGGYQEESPEPFIYGYIWCNNIIGEIGHSCCHGEGPHQIKVCIVEEDNSPEMFKQLLSFAGVPR
jgi:ribosomal protein S27AE